MFIPSSPAGSSASPGFIVRYLAFLDFCTENIFSARYRRNQPCSWLLVLLHLAMLSCFLVNLIQDLDPLPPSLPPSTTPGADFQQHPARKSKQSRQRELEAQMYLMGWFGTNYQLEPILTEQPCCSTLTRSFIFFFCREVTGTGMYSPESVSMSNTVLTVSRRLDSHMDKKKKKNMYALSSP